ncbi:hypothetical protein AAY473_015574 [Plecturocebus cupreus]
MPQLPKWLRLQDPDTKSIKPSGPCFRKPKNLSSRSEYLEVISWKLAATSEQPEVSGRKLAATSEQPEARGRKLAATSEQPEARGRKLAATNLLFTIIHAQNITFEHQIVKIRPGRKKVRSTAVFE